jgi:nanoRNase/pAp phosphatase (c-di-AMP/oligoRNAs hydrolase)
MNKKALITHIADPDGAFPIILSKLVFDNMDTFSCDVKEVDQTLTNILESNEVYDAIYIVDLNITEEMAIKINKDETLKEKIKVFDHHATNEFLNKYPFEKVVIEKDGRKECGTTLFYEYLKTYYDKEILHKESLTTLIELIRQNDTFDFKEETKKQAFDLSAIYEIYGREKYIEHYYHFIKENDTFYFTEVEKTLLEIENDKTTAYIEEKLSHVKFATIHNINVGIVFAEKNRSILGNEMATRFQDKIDIAIIINVDRSVSYRAVKEEVDIASLAIPQKGGGHKHAGGSPLPKDIQQKITEYIFKEVKWIEA